MIKDTGENIFQQALAESVHFSLKIVNSNIKGGGIRLANSSKLDLPYISARTLLSENIHVPATYHTNSGKSATLFKVVNALQLNEDLSESDDEFKQNVSILKPHLKTAFEQSFSSGLDIVDIRMRQLLIPKDDEYLSISPLSAAGVNLLLNIEVDALKEKRKVDGKDSKLKNIQTAVFGIGGSNIQNVGTPPLIRAMQRPIILASPTLEPKTRLAFQYFYKGFDYEISSAYINHEMYVELTRYAQQLIQQQKLTAELGFDEIGIQAPFANLKQRQQERSTIQKVLDDVLQQGHRIFSILQNIENQLPTHEALQRLSFWSHPRVSMIAQGLINQDIQQFDDWKILFADDLALKITQHRYWKKEIKNNVGITLSEANAKPFLSRCIQELLK